MSGIRGNVDLIDDNGGELFDPINLGDRPKTQAGISYLYNNDAAICVFRMESINEALLNIVDHPDVVIRYAQNAYELGINKHNRDEIEKELQNDFRRIIHEYRYSK